MQLISFRATSLFKRGIWLSAAALMAAVAAPAVINGTLRRNPGAAILPIAILGALWAYFMWKTQIHRLADRVVDCEDHFEVWRGRTEEIIAFANVASAEVVTGSGLHRIRLRLCAPTKLGAQIQFMPPASLWSNPAAVRRLAESLSERALLAKFEKPVS